MKKLIPFILIALLTGFCGKKEEKEESSEQKDLAEEIYRAIPGQYLVFLPEQSVMQSVGQQKGLPRKDYKKQTEKERNNGKEKVKALMRQHQIAIDTNRIFSDVAVGVSAKMTEKQAKDIAKDGIKVLQDYEILFRNPIHQDVFRARNPIHQDMNITDESNGTTCAVAKAGGPKDGTGKRTVVWVVDTGIQLDHPDLVVETDPELAKSMIPWDTDANDYHGHGTHVAGIIGAKNDPDGMVGVSAGATVIPVKVFENSGRSTWTYLIEGLNHVAQYKNEGDVVNLSLGAYKNNICNDSDFDEVKAVLNRLAASKVFIVMAAGNDGKKAKDNMPGCLEGDNLFTVASVTCDNKCEAYSNYGQPPVDWVAVGTSVFSTYYNSTYRILSGTSMATAIVSGVIHANGGPPVSGGTIRCKNKTYNYAKTN